MKTENKNLGKGGTHCPCCRPIIGTLKQIKQYLNRWERRKAKQNLHAQLDR